MRRERKMERSPECEGAKRCLKFINEEGDFLRKEIPWRFDPYWGGCVDCLWIRKAEEEKRIAGNSL